jgi:hypothetical protein
METPRFTLPGTDRRTLGVAALFVVAGVLWQSTFPHLLGVDGFYHLAQTRSILAEGLGAGMPWMQYSIFEDGWVDHHLGYHVALLPFVAWPGGILGGKLAAGVMGGAAIAAMYLWLRAFRVPHAAWLALVPVAASWGFVFRLGMVRAVALSTIFLVAALWASVRGRNKTLFVVSVAYALSYHLSVLVIPISIGALLVHRLMGDQGIRLWGLERVDHGEVAASAPNPWTPVVATLGFVVGFTVHPHFPTTWTFFFTHVIVGLDLAGVPHGAEWAAAGLRDGWMQGFGLAALLAGGVVWARRCSLRWETVLLLVGAVCGVALSVKSVRFVELSMPLVTLAAGLLLRDSTWEPTRRIRVTGAALVLGLAALTLGRATDNGDSDPHRYAAAGDWMRANVAPGDGVYNFRWGDWSELVFHAPEQRYPFGLEPAFMAGKYPEKWRHFWAIRTGEYGNVGAAIKAEFGSSWVFTGLPEPGVLKLFDADPALERAVVGPHFAIYRVVD